MIGSYSNIHYLHDNAKPHVAAQSLKKLNELGLTILPHPPYSPDLAPSDFYLFSPMKSVLQGHTYCNEKDVMKVIEDWFREKPESFFADGIKKLPERWRRCVAHNGEYFEHFYH